MHTECRLDAYEKTATALGESEILTRSVWSGLALGARAYRLRNRLAPSRAEPRDFS